MRKPISLLTIAAIGFTVAAEAPGSAQSPFTVKVVDPKNRRPVQSVIKWGNGDGKWHYLRKTDARGTLSSSCPGPLLMATPEVWEYRESEPQDCASQVTLEVELRDPSAVVAELMEFGRESGPIDRQDFAVAYAREVSNRIAAAGEAGSDSEAALLARYASDPGRLSAADIRSVESLALTRTEREFERLDADRDRRLSPAELGVAAARGD